MTKHELRNAVRRVAYEADVSTAESELLEKDIVELIDRAHDEGFNLGLQRAAEIAIIHSKSVSKGAGALGVRIANAIEAAKKKI